MGVSRRQVLAMGLLGGAALALPVQPAIAQSLRDRLPESRLPAPFTEELRMLEDAVPTRTEADTAFYTMTMREAQARILPVQDFPTTTIFGYDGLTPGRTIRARRGTGVVVRFVNDLPDVHPTLRYECTTSVHLHGNASPPQFDGWAEDLTAPGFFKDYLYPNEQDERMLWYHDHAVHHTAENTYMGLAGLYITDEGLNLPLPKGRYEVPLVLQDKIFDTNGQFIFDSDGEDELMGDVILVNGTPWPVLTVERRKYLFRFCNASTSRGYRLALSTGEPFTFVSGDGGLYPAPQQAASFRIGPAERYGVVVDFARYPIGTRVVLRNRELDNNEDFRSTRQVMRFDVVADASNTDNNTVPDVLNTSRDRYNPMLLRESDAVRTRNWRFERTNGEWAINGRFWDPNRIEANPPLDGVEIWRFENSSGGWFHPIHVHLVDFRVLDRNGRTPFGYERGPKDTVYVGGNETVRVIARFGPRRGRYMMHCHNVVHEDHDMMVNFEVGQGGPDPVATAPPRPVEELASTPLLRPADPR